MIEIEECKLPEGVKRYKCEYYLNINSQKMEFVADSPLDITDKLAEISKENGDTIIPYTIHSILTNGIAKDGGILREIGKDGYIYNIDEGTDQYDMYMKDGESKVYNKNENTSSIIPTEKFIELTGNMLELIESLNLYKQYLELANAKFATPELHCSICGIEIESAICLDGHNLKICTSCIGRKKDNRDK